jgi:hypothetical protein
MSDAGAVVVVDRFSPARLVPIPAALVLVLRSVLEMIRGDTHPVPADFSVILQAIPRKRIVVVADAEEAAEAENRVRHAPTRLLDHDALNLADLLVVGAVDAGLVSLPSITMEFSFVTGED